MLTKRSIRAAIDTVLALRELGVRVYADGNTVRVAGPPELVTDAVRRAIARKNLDYLAALRWIEADKVAFAVQRERMSALRDLALREYAERQRAADRWHADHDRRCIEYERSILRGPAAIKKDNP